MTWGLVYQDLKPANLLVADQDRVSVLDLGGCQLINMDTGQKLLPGACTTGYCPPECEQPYGVLNPSADVYTVGSTLFHLLTGRSPLDFLGPGLGSQIRAVRLDLNLPGGCCRPATRRLLQRCLAVNAAERYRDAEELHQAIEGILE
jgi:serine/threonine protein kinase